MARGMIIGSGGGAMQIGDVTLEDKSAEVGNGFLVCDGSAVNQSQYPVLYEKLVRNGKANLPSYNITAYIKSGVPK